MSGIEQNKNFKLLSNGTVIIENYNQLRPFSSFFPGIAGLKGIPMWAFYINRGQCIAAFGTKDKNNAMLEFFPANSAYSFTQNYGFRTFVKVKKQSTYYEPFRDVPEKSKENIFQKMKIRPHELVIEDVNKDIGLMTTVKYFTLPNEPISALMRIVEFENISENELDFQVIDGLPKVMPFGINEWVQKHMSNIAQAWVEVPNFSKTGIPYYKIKVEINDCPEVKEVVKGNFYLSLFGEDLLKRAKIIIDPNVIFGQDLSFQIPHHWINNNDFTVPDGQVEENKYPCAFSCLDVKISSGKKQVLYSVFGHANSQEIVGKYASKIHGKRYFDSKTVENHEVVNELTNNINTESGKKVFDYYCRQTFLDNLMRGGMPINIPGSSKIFYVYSRKHGDPEREYNNFQLAPSYYSQGNGNYRDVNQNRRNDVFFNPKVKDFNVRLFYNLVQLDGYNPLVVKGVSYYLNAKKADKIIRDTVQIKDKKALKEFFAQSFNPGSLLLFLESHRIKLKVDNTVFLGAVINEAEYVEDADHGEGFWVDHWTYNLDLIESYLGVFPEEERKLLIDGKDFTFYDNDHIVLPRSEKYVLADGKVRQFGSVCVHKEKQKMINSRKEMPRLVRIKKGKGPVFKTTLLVKIITLILNKFAALDSEGIGIEMEADKPGWYDPLNGLPGVFGSSVCETFELKRVMIFLKKKLAGLDLDDNYKIKVPVEINRFFTGLYNLAKKLKNTSPNLFWDKATSIKENYRKEILFGISGIEKPVTLKDLLGFLDLAIDKIDHGLKRALSPKSGLYYTYFSYEAQKYSKTGKTNHKGLPVVKISSFKKRALPFFLEGEVHYLKTEKRLEKIKQFYNWMRESQLFDKRLNMYKVNASLKNEPNDIGRCKIFTPSWLENESVWLHMEYKYLLELLKAGLYKEFFDDFSKAAVCFLNPEVYGRSILENSSFIVSSEFFDKNQWGRGFVARLSGSSAEFIDMWLRITVGDRPFRVGSDGTLNLIFEPKIPREYFDENGIFSFSFLGSTAVTYLNKEKIDTFSDKFSIDSIMIHWKDGQKEKIEGNLIPEVPAEKIRNQEAKSITIHF